MSATVNRDDGEPEPEPCEGKGRDGELLLWDGWMDGWWELEPGGGGGGGAPHNFLCLRVGSCGGVEGDGDGDVVLRRGQSNLDLG